MKVLLTGGGSGGHISPALAVANVLKQQPNCELLYVGGKMTMEGTSGPSIEEQLVAPTGIPYTSIRSGKLARDRISLTTFKRLWGAVPGLFDAYRVVGQFNPDVVFSSGGYVSLPVVVAAWARRIPVVIHEQTAGVGLANSIAGKVATKVAITFPQSAKYFPKAKTVVTGNPIRSEILNPKPVDSEFGKWLQGKGLPILYITGGGLGSHILNTTVESVLPELLETYRVIHQCGAHEKFKDYDRLLLAKQSLPQKLQERYWPSKYFNAEEVSVVYQRAAAAVARSGANTVLEFAAVGLPAIFVPIPWVTHDEQTKNAQVLVEAGTAAILPEKELSGERLLRELNLLLLDKKVTDKEKAKAKQLVVEDAAQAIVDLVVVAARLTEVKQPSKLRK